MKISIFILCHHKPWLIRSSLLSLLSQQGEKDYDLHFILIKGSGENRNNKMYKEYFKVKKVKGEKNNQLSNFDKNIFNEINKLKIKYQIHEFENDHGLDSGAWLKLIKTNIWKKYDYSLFLMEGFLFSSDKVLLSLKKFLKKNKPDFISSAHEKRFYKFDKKEIRKEVFKKYHNESIKNIWTQLLKIKKLKKIYIKTPNHIVRRGKKIRNITEHHISNYSLNFIEKLKLIIKSILFEGHLYIENQSVLVTTNKKLFIKAKDISKKIINIDEIQYHEEKNPFFFGCSCQHIFSKKMICDIRDFAKKNKIYKISKMPYFGEVFEIIWGALPRVLNKKKWYFNGIHRVRKNLINYKREDNIAGMLKYLNLYNYNKINFYQKKGKIRFKVLNKGSFISKFIN